MTDHQPDVFSGTARPERSTVPGWPERRLSGRHGSLYGSVWNARKGEFQTAAARSRDDPPPGGALVFQLLGDAHGRSYVRAQGLDQLRRLKPGAGYRAPLIIPGCGAPCPLDRFRELVTAKRARDRVRPPTPGGIEAGLALDLPRTPGDPREDGEPATGSISARPVLRFPRRQRQCAAEALAPVGPRTPGQRAWHFLRKRRRSHSASGAPAACDEPS